MDRLEGSGALPRMPVQGGITGRHAQKAPVAVLAATCVRISAHRSNLRREHPMSLIQFTENYEDLSTDRGYQFKFLCDRCHNGVMSNFQASVMGTAAGLFRAAGDMFGGVFSNASSSAYDIQRAVGGKGHDDALRAAVTEVKPVFRQCRRCSKWVCESCWNVKRGMCFNCAPDVQAELAAAQVAETVNQIQEGVKNV